MHEIICCPTCDLIQKAAAPARGQVVKCARCGSTVIKRKPKSISRTAAFALAALVLYLPANIFPVVEVDYMGRHETTTIWEGARSLFEAGAWGVGLLVFVTSMLTPFLKMAGLLFLVATARSGKWRNLRTSIFHVVEFVNPWNMLEIFMLALLVALVKMGELATVMPGLGAFAFAGVVAATVAASQCFDPRTIWDDPKRR